MSKARSAILILAACLAWMAVESSAATGLVTDPPGKAVPASTGENPTAENPAAALPPGLPPERKAAALAHETVGREALDILRNSGYLIIQEDEGGARLQDGTWDALREFAAKSFAALDLAEAYRRFASGNPVAPANEPLGFTALRELGTGGLMTPDLQSAALLLIAAHEDMSVPGYAKAETAAAEGTLFDTPWGAAFAARTRADVLPDPSHLADALFDEHFAGVRRNEEAVEHFSRFIAAAYGKDLSVLLDTDVRNATLSGELRGWIKSYLLDQRRVNSVKRHRQSLDKLAAKRGLAEQIARLEKAATALRGASGLADSLKAALAQSPSDAAAPAAPRVKLTSAGLHLHKPVKLDRHEHGDTVVLTSAYWVDGLADRETATIEETTFADHGKDGADSVEMSKQRRANGGPYTVKRELVLKDSRSLTFHLIIGSEEANTLKETFAIPVDDAFDQALSSLAVADHQALDCRFMEAEASYDRLESSIDETTAAKKQYADLLSSAQKRRSEAAKNAVVVANLEAAITASREDLSSQKCDYLTQRTEASVKTIASLPAGCDRYLADLQSQLGTIYKRKNDQAAFQQAVAKARTLEKECRFSSAAEGMAQALAILVADPAARCGVFDETAKKLEEDLPAVRVMALWDQALEKSVQEAQSPPNPGSDPSAASLRIANASLARIPTLSLPACFAKHREALIKAADSSGKSLLVPADAAAVKLMPDDDKLVATSAAVTEERRRIEATQAAVQERKAQQELPPAETPQAAPEPAAQAAPKAQAAPALKTGEAKATPATPQPKARTSTAPKHPSLGESPAKTRTPSGDAAKPRRVTKRKYSPK